MKRITLIAAAAALVGLQVGAQEFNDQNLAAIDTNGDGAVSREEFDAYGARGYQALDTNRDGSLSAAELEGRITVVGLDADGDGIVSRQEFGRMLSADFAAADKDGNGMID